MKHNVQSFIERVLVNEIRTIVDSDAHCFVSVALMVQGIEFLGACLGENGSTANQFREAIRQLFPTSYHRFNEGDQFDLHKNLSGGFAPILNPESRVKIIVDHDTSEFGKHLEVKNIIGEPKLVLVTQALFNDFEQACVNIQSKIERSEIKSVQLNGCLVAVDPDAGE